MKVSPIRCSAEWLVLGKDVRIDPWAIVGEMPERQINDLKLVVGDHSRVRSGTVLYLGTVIGSHFNSGHHVVIREENRIGDHVSIWGNSTVDYGCRIGDGVRIHTGVYIPQFTVIENDVFIAPGVIMGNDPHPGCRRSRECLKGPIIRRGARIGLNVTLLPHVVIGEQALIGAGSVVTRSIPPSSVAFGNPARVVGRIDELACWHDPPWVQRPYETD